MPFISYLPYILACTLQNLRPNLDQKVGRATYTPGGVSFSFRPSGG